MLRPTSSALNEKVGNIHELALPFTYSINSSLDLRPNMINGIEIN
jgi:hypothetical protein